MACTSVPFSVQKDKSDHVDHGNGAGAGTVKPKKKVAEPKVLDSKVAHTLCMSLGTSAFVLASLTQLCFFPAILQASLKMSHEEFHAAILEVDEEKLSEGTLQQLIQALPEPDILLKLNEYKDEIDELGEAEQFVLKVRANLGQMRMGDIPQSALSVMLDQEAQATSRIDLFQNEFRRHGRRCEAGE